MFENVLLEQEHKDLLATFVEAVRNTPRDQREKFFVLQTQQGDFIRHPGLRGRNMSVYMGDVEALANEGFLTISYSSRGTPSFDVTPRGFAYYEYLKQQISEPAQKIETITKGYLNLPEFKEKYPAAYQKWSDAEQMLWNSDSERQLTTIGHLCREAIQQFATALVNKHQPPNVDVDITHTIARIRAVLNLKAKQLGGAEKAFLDALLPYWGTVNDLIQRQEHSGQKEGPPLI